MTYTLWHGDCLEEMSRIEDGSVDAIICDLPFGQTANDWDVAIPFEPLWKQYKRVIKRNGAIVLFGTEPFSSFLRLSNLDWYKYDWIWEKTRPFDIYNCKNKPLRAHEYILVFSPGNVASGSGNMMTYNPQGLIKVDKPWKRPRFYKTGHRAHRQSDQLERVIEFTGYPRSILHFANPNNGNVHPTQKPLPLMEYLVLTFTNEGDTILDNCAGSGSTLESAMRCNRHSIGIEKNAHYFQLASQRLKCVAAELRGELNHLPMFAEAA